ncbi:PREDICTED: iroquois-class homeodomain protein IRX-5-like [Thamnophis sirtalis]|uniref:Iroquois-class homeodomain protein IRX-5-like n=1 Tax=Thamnophis sirtalis TaxID=35019 RepID=A0A6I9Y4Z8_9SAUR|nr:PREDICTED: iroquois-class homeodomain protein IRX-5-like [Thamnophis sirtalis]
MRMSKGRLGPLPKFTGPADPKGAGGGKDTDGASSDSDCKESPEQTLRKDASPPLQQQQQQLLHPEDPPPPPPSQYRPPSTDLHPGLPASHATSVIHTPQAPPQAAGPGALSKPKLWSLAEIATSADKAKEGGSGETPPQTPSCLNGPAAQSPTARSPSAAPCPFPNGAAASVLPRPLYYATSPFYPGYTNYASFGHLHGSAAQAGAPSPHFNGLNQTLLNRAESLAKDAKILRSQNQYDFSKESPYELKKGMSHI